MARIFLGTFVVVCATFVGPSANAGIVFSDHFTSNTLDPAWNVTFANATGWTYTTPSGSGTHLVVTDILGVPIQNDSGTTWGNVRLSRSFQPVVGDFHLQFDINWDSEGRLDPMQAVYLTLLDPNQQYVANSGYVDTWVGFSATSIAGIDDVGFVQSGNGSLPLSGSASIEFERVGSTLAIKWNGQQLISGANLTPLAEVQLNFEFFNYNGFAGRSTFANESVDLIRLSTPDSTAAVPEPASLALWSLGAFGMALVHRRRRPLVRRQAVPGNSSMRIPAKALITIAVWLSSWPALQCNAAIVVSDATFDPADWSTTIYGSSGGAAHSASQSAGGNPGTYRFMTHSLPGPSNIGVFHQFLSFSYNPSISGAIASLDYREDRIELNPPFAGAAIGATAALLQNGVLFFGPDLTFSNTTWQTAQVLGLTAADFTSSSATNPDFSASGGLIRFGYSRSNTNSSGGALIAQHGIDNWSFAIQTQSPAVPEPATFLAWSTFALLGLVARARLAIGDRVAIIRGTFAGLCGTVIKLARQGRYLLLKNRQSARRRLSDRKSNHDPGRTRPAPLSTSFLITHSPNRLSDKSTRCPPALHPPSLRLSVSPSLHPALRACRPTPQTTTYSGPASLTPQSVVVLLTRMSHMCTFDTN